MNDTLPLSRGATGPGGPGHPGGHGRPEHRDLHPAQPGRPVLLRALHAEALKLAALPGAWVGAALTVVLPVALVLFNTRGMADELAADPGSYLHEMRPDMGVMDASFGVVGVVVLATVCLAAEHTPNTQTLGSARQVSTTLLVEPRRSATVAAKVLLVLATAAVLAALTCALTFTITTRALGEWSPTLWPVPWGRVAGLYAWWVVSALGAMGLACLTRGALVPLTWCVTTTVLVSPSLLLSRVTDLAAGLPDAAAYSLMLTDYSGRALPAGGAWAALAAWALAGLALTVVPWTRKDA
ncbi:MULTISPECIES: ABC transporter permease [unclassified Actinomyces]|uniref:ABC transporter permease n=1 Tax=unclassified Actinomyces TaxID=2609248 RepID=UPI00201711F4|nr:MULTISPECIES: ABC transporter permease [unclassified Actinomyces]MCL3777215.1 ABC transporter [Actinomyces sp. AC-20-1]MCL3789290.1 ABC transporter [Actinomyces sp. 187325]MCL3791710.1 ABC transporter [Actinomyces sp. 186855]MCL3794250.1 ABC transporter [Actinomyces sp. 217892]